MASSFGERARRQGPQRDSALGRLHKSLNSSNAQHSNDGIRPKTSAGFLDSSKENSSGYNSIAGKGKIPNTPFSLLKEEIDDDEQSLLCDSPSVKASTLLASSTSKSVRFQKKHSVRRYEEALHSGKKQTPGQIGYADDTRTTSFLPASSLQSASSIKSPPESRQRETVYTIPSPVLEDSPNRPLASLSAIHPKHSATPFSINKKGICMDLSDIFVAAGKPTTVKKTGPTPARPPRPAVVASSVTKSIAINERDHLDESEEMMFTNWLNQMLCPIDDTTTETGAFHVLVMKQKWSRISVKAKQVLQSIDFDPLKSHIWKGKLKLREDNDVSANIGCRKQLLELLCSYSPHWLRLGLETCFPIVFHSNDRSTLRKFIVTNVVQDTDILNKYTHGKCKVPSGSFEQSYREELRTVVLFRILKLVCFLDVAKRHEVLDRPLFHIKATVKSSKKLLFQFCCEFMKGEGNIVKHLTRLGLNVLVEQNAREELEFRITNIKVDLCDGVRLTRLAEILSGASLISKLRLPVVSRLQKFHNVKLALHSLNGIPESILAHHIVDGHRQQVLRFLWSIVAYYCLPNLLSTEQVVAEVQRIQTLKRIGRIITSCDRLESALLEWSKLICSFYQCNIRDLGPSFGDGKAVCYLIHYYHPEFINLEVLHSKNRVWNLAEEGMASIGGIPVFIPDAKEEPVTLCLSFLCSRMMETRKQVDATRTIQCLYRRHHVKVLRARKKVAAAMILIAWRRRKHQFYDNQARRFAKPVRIIESYVIKYWDKLLKNLRFKNEQQSMSAVAAMRLQRFARSSVFRRRFWRAVERKAAACAIQACLRRFQARSFYFQLCARNRAALVIQEALFRFWELRERQQKAAVVIQTCWRRFNEQMNFAVAILDVVDIQRFVRGFLSRRKRDALLLHVVILQAFARQVVAFNRVECLRVRLTQSRAAVSIQNIVRRNFAMGEVNTLRKRRYACVLFQCLWRRRAARLTFYDLKATFEEKVAAVTIQATSRVFLSRRRAQILRRRKIERESATVMQAAWRVVLAKQAATIRREAKTRTLAAIALQSFFRMILANFLLQKLKRKRLHTSAATVIQSRWRCFFTRRNFAIAKSSATYIQATMRGHAQRCLYWITIQCVIRVQSHWRAATAKRHFTRSVASAVLFQAYVRRKLAATVAKQRLVFAVKVQSFARVSLSRNELQRRKVAFLLNNYAASVVQRYWRGHVAFLKYLFIRADILVVQRYARRNIAMVHVKKRKLAVLDIQKYCRRFLARRVLLELKEQVRRIKRLKLRSATSIQAIFRGYTTRKTFYKLASEATRIQSQVRGAIARTFYKQERSQIIAVQSKVRQWLSMAQQRRRKFALGRLQCWARVSLACQARTKLIAQRERKRLEIAAAIFIQCFVRQVQAQRSLLKELSARKIQKTWRCYNVHVSYMMYVVSALEIQTWTRRYFAMCEYDRRYDAMVFLQAVSRGFLRRRELAKQRLASTSIQCLFRMFAARRELHLRFFECYAATLIASILRMYPAKKSFLRCREAAMILQRCFRGFRERSRLSRRHCAAKKIQACFRCSVAQRDFDRMKEAATLIQTRARMLIAVEKTIWLVCEKIAHRRLLQRSATKIQFAWLEWMERRRQDHAAKTIQAKYNRWMAQCRFKRLRFGILRLQAVARGRRNRKSFRKKNRELSKRIASANTFARSNPEYRLANRARAALAKVLRSKSLTATMKAIWVLELSTRISYDFCDSFSRSGAIEILFQLMNLCNRSLPHLQLQYGILLTLSNVLKYDAFVQYIVSEKIAAMLISFLHLFQDNQCLFAQTLVLFGRLIRFVDNPSQFCGKDDTKRFKAVVEMYSRKYSHKVTMTQSAGLLLSIGKGRVLDRQKTLAMANGLLKRFDRISRADRKARDREGRYI